MEEKSLENTNFKDVEKTTSDVVAFGNGNLFRLMSKASSEAQGWMKSSKVLEVSGCGCVVQVTTEQRNPDGSKSLAEAVCFVPGAQVIEDENGDLKLSN